MGKTWSNEQRRKFGKRKTRRHRTRAAFKKMNPGIRLRTLAVDLADFQDEKGEGAVPLHVTKVPQSNLVADNRIRAFGIGKTERQLKKEEERESPDLKREKKKPTPESRNSLFDYQLARDNVNLDHPSLTGIGQEAYRRYKAMSDEELQRHIDFLKTQMKFLTAIARGFRNEAELETAERIRDSKDDYLQGELNAVMLYQQRFR